METKKEMLSRQVKDIKLKKGMRVKELIESMDAVGGFSAQHIDNRGKSAKEDV